MLTRAVGIASLPLTLDQPQVSDLQDHPSDLNGLDTAFTNLQQSVASLQTTISSGLLALPYPNSPQSAPLSARARRRGLTPFRWANSVLIRPPSAMPAPPRSPIPTSQGISKSTSYNLYRGHDDDHDHCRFLLSAGSGERHQLAVQRTGAGDAGERRLDQFAGLSPLAAVRNTWAGAVDLQDSSGNDLISSSTAVTRQLLGHGQLRSIRAPAGRSRSLRALR